MKKQKQQELEKQEQKQQAEQETNKVSIFYRFLEWIATPSKKLHVNRQILVVAYVFAFLFIGMIGYLGYYVAVKSQEDIVSSYNPRKDLFKDKVIKGEIQTEDGKVIARSVNTTEDNYEREYPFANLFSHVAGYDIYGKSGIESSANYYMYSSNANILEKLVNDLKDEKNMGDTVVSTLRYDLQKTAYDALGNRKGAVVVMEVSTGKVLAMVSKPDYNPNTLEEQWDKLTEDEDSTLLNRASQGLYPPGSTFKIVTALAYMREHSNWNKFSYQCNAKTTVDNVNIKCAGNKAHGKVNLSKAMAASCNCAFVNLATDISFSNFQQTAQSLLFNQSLPVSIEYSKSLFYLNKKSNKSEMPQTAIGQGDTLITPLLNCMIVASVANDGVMMAPYFVDHIESYDGRLVKKMTPSMIGEVMTEEETDALEEMLVDVVETGTASALSGLAHTYAGKTGSAEHAESNIAHGWFVGYTPVEQPEIAVSVIVEEGGSGGSSAIPVARQIFNVYYD